MLRQALIIPSRALRSSTRSIAQRTVTRPQTFIAPIAVRRIQPAAARWYSETPKESQEASKKEGEADAKPAAEGQESAEPAKPAEDPAVTELKKQLETKDKEAAEWKVGGAKIWNIPLYSQTDTKSRTNAFVPSPISATSKTGPSAR